MNENRRKNELDDVETIPRLTCSDKCKDRQEHSTQGGDFATELKESRIKKLRLMQVKDKVLPNMKAKLWASKLNDEIDGTEGI